MRTIIEDGFTAALPSSGGSSTAPATYARKLRRVLIAALASESDRRVALTELCSEASYMFCYASSRVEHTHAALGDGPHHAIVAFLEWVADGELPVRDRYLAISGLRWVWTRFGVDRVRTAAFFDELATYRRPPLADPAAEQLACQIEVAFADTPYPFTITTAESDAARNVALLFHDQRWPSLHPELLELEPDAMRVFTDEAVRYFMPAYLLCAVAGIALEVDVLASVTEEHLVLFTREERATIEAVLAR